MYFDYYISTGRYLNRPIYKKLEFFDDLFQHFRESPCTAINTKLFTSVHYLKIVYWLSYIRVYPNVNGCV